LILKLLLCLQKDREAHLEKMKDKPDLKTSGPGGKNFSTER
jgi:hypothetical protein